MDDNVEQMTGEGQKGVFQSIVEAISGTMNLPASVWVLDKPSQSLKIVASVGLPVSYTHSAFLTLDEESVTGETFKTGQVVTTHDILSDPRWKYKDIAREMGWKSSLCVPIKAHGDVIGVLSIYTFVIRDFTDTEKQLLTNYATQVELTLEADRRRKALARLLEAGHQIEQLITRQPQVVLEEIVKGACDVIGADCAVLYPYDPRREDFYDVGSVVACGLNKELELSEKPRSQTGMAAYVKREGEVIVSNIEKQDPEMLTSSPFIVREEIRAFMGVALRVGPDVLGILYVDFRAPHDFADEENDTIRLFAHQASIAIQNARFFEQRQVLQDIARDITSILDKDELLHRILKRSLDLLGCEAGSICLLNKQTNELEFQYAIGKEKYLSVPFGKGLIGTAAQWRKPVRVGAVKQDSRYIEHVPETQSELDVPLVISDELIGVLNAESKKVNAFGEAEEKLALVLADQAAVALYNAQLFQQSQEQLAQQGALVEFGRAVTSGIRLREDEVLDLIYRQASTLMDTDNMFIALYDEKTDTVLFPLVMKDGRRIEWPPRQGGRGRTNYIIRTKESIFLPTRQESEDWYKQPDREDYTRASLGPWMGVPMMAGDRVLGVVATYSPTQDYAFDQADLHILRSLANMAAIALDNARLYYDVNERLGILHQLGNDLNSKLRLKPQEIVELIYQRASKLMDTSNMYVALYNEGTDTVSFPLLMKDGQELEMPPRRAGQGRTEEIIRTKQPIFLPTRQKSEDWYKQPGRAEYVGQALPSWMGVPMMAGDRVVGVIATYHPTEEYLYDQDDLNVLTSLANVAAIALDNAKLYYDVNRRLQILNQVGNDLTSKLRLQPHEIAELVYQHASELMDTSNMYIALYDEGTDTVSFPLLLKNGQRLKMPARRAGAGRTEDIIRTKQPIFLPTRQESDDWYNQPGRENYAQDSFGAWMGIPLMAGKNVVGVIATYHPTQDYFYDQDDLNILTALANVTAIALDNAALYHGIKLAETVREINNAIETYAELPRFLQSILELSLPKAGAKAGTIQFLDKARDELIVQAAVGQVVEQKYRHIPLSQGITGQVAREGHTVYIPDTKRTTEFLPYLGQMLSELAVPLKAGGQVIGVLNVEDARVDAFREEQRELLELIADQASIAIQQKLRLEEEQKKRMAAELDAEIGQLARDIAHYVKNQIGMVRLDAIDLLSEKAIISEAVRNKCQERILRNAELTIRLANDLFAPYRREEAPEWIEVASLVSEAMGLVRFEGISYEVNLPSTLPKVFIDKSGAVEVFHELFVNARKAMATRDQVEKWIHVEGQIGNDNRVEVFIINNGPPIPSDKWATIFRQFQQMTGRDEQREGVGLGLWIARTFMRRQGGEVSVHHSDERETAFLVRFPVPPQE